MDYINLFRLVSFLKNIFTHRYFSTTRAHLMSALKSIHHLRVLKEFSDKPGKKMTDYERHLIRHVSLPTARKIIKDLINANLVSCEASNNDKRMKLLTVKETDYDRYI